MFQSQRNNSQGLSEWDAIGSGNILSKPVSRRSPSIDKTIKQSPALQSKAHLNRIDLIPDFGASCKKIDPKDLIREV
jgi:hypothetical protein